VSCSFVFHPCLRESWHHSAPWSCQQRPPQTLISAEGNVFFLCTSPSPLLTRSHVASSLYPGMSQQLRAQRGNATAGAKCVSSPIQPLAAVQDTNRPGCAARCQGHMEKKAGWSGWRAVRAAWAAGQSAFPCVQPTCEPSGSIPADKEGRTQIWVEVLIWKKNRNQGTFLNTSGLLGKSEF
jgi:hypothetical protein